MGDPSMGFPKVQEMPAGIDLQKGESSLQSDNIEEKLNANWQDISLHVG